MPHKKSLPRSLHKARHEIGITFKFELTPQTSPKKSLVKQPPVTDHQNTDIDESTAAIGLASSHLDSANVGAGLVDGKHGLVALGSSRVSGGGGGALEETTSSSSPSSSPQSTHSKKGNNPGDEQIEIATFMAAHGQSPPPTKVKQEETFAAESTVVGGGGGGEGDDDLDQQVGAEKVITGYNLHTAIKTVSSITLMRRIQSHSPEKTRNGLNSRGFPRSTSVTSFGSASNTSSKASKMGPAKEKKRRVAQVSNFPGECVWCGTHKTAQWRRGPLGARSLCNVCLAAYPLSVYLLYTD